MPHQRTPDHLLEDTRQPREDAGLTRAVERVGYSAAYEYATNKRDIHVEFQEWLDNKLAAAGVSLEDERTFVLAPTWAKDLLAIFYTHIAEKHQNAAREAAAERYHEEARNRGN